MKHSVPQIINNLRSYRLVLYIGIASLVMVLFTYLTPPMFNRPFFQFLVSFEELTGIDAIYSSRFMLSFLLLGLVPLFVAVICGDTPSLLGLNFRIKPFRRSHMFIFIIIAIIAGINRDE